VTAAQARVDRETAKAEKALAEFTALADRLSALAEERSRPWWRRLPIAHPLTFFAELRRQVFNPLVWFPFKPATSEMII
jgi:hypothetical protein